VTSKAKALIIVGAVVVAGVGVYASTVYTQRGVVTVQTGNVARQDLTSIVTASGEIKPKNYIDIGADAIGDLTDILVKEGDQVKKGQLLAKIEDVQPAADVDAQKATLDASKADVTADEAALKAAEENIEMSQSAVDQANAQLDEAKTDYDRSTAEYNEQLLAKQDFDAKKYAYDAQKAAVAQSVSRLQQAQTQKEQSAANLAGANRRVAQAMANLAPWMTFWPSTIPTPPSPGWSPTSPSGSAKPWSRAFRINRVR